MKHLALSALQKEIIEGNVPGFESPGENIWECMHSSMENHSDVDKEEINSPFTKTSERLSSA